jgi:hypothetical protein
MHMMAIRMAKPSGLLVRLLVLATALVAAVTTSPAARAESASDGAPVTVTVENFIRAETDLYPYLAA